MFANIRKCSNARILYKNTVNSLINIFLECFGTWFCMNILKEKRSSVLPEISKYILGGLGLCRGRFMLPPDAAIDKYHFTISHEI